VADSGPGVQVGPERGLSVGSCRHEVEPAAPDKKPMHLCDPQAVEGGIAYLTYQPVRNAQRAPCQPAV
jgi:hypothetical protein